MLKIHQIFFRKFVVLFLLIVFISAIVTYYTLKSIGLKGIEKNLKNYIYLAQFELKNSSDFDTFAKKISDKCSVRVTIISKDGVVLAESDRDKKTMELHSNRKEIIEAVDKDFGVVLRKSKTLSQEFLYVAKKIYYKESHIFLRVAKSNLEIINNFINLSFKIIFIFSLFLLILFYVIYHLGEKINKEIDKILNNLKLLSNKNYNIINGIEESFSKEFYQIEKFLKKISKKLQKQERQKSKQTAKLKFFNRQKDEIISAISHEFKNPIAVISGYSQMLSKEDDINPQIQKKFLQKIESNAKKLTQMIDRFKLVIKLESGEFQITKKNLNLNEIIKEAIESLKDIAKERKITFIENAKDINIEADDILLEIVIKNLIDNAIKYSEEEIKVELNENSFFIQDRGIGIKEENLNLITKKFYRVSSNQWNNSMGLGLSIVDYIIKLHHFRLEIKSQYGIGSTFCIYF